MREKLQNSRGETLVEVLASVLVCTLSIMLLLGAVTASANIDLQAQSADAEFYDALSRAERQGPDDGFSAGGALKVTNKDGAFKDITGLSFYGREQLLSYAADSPAPVPPPAPEPGGDP